MTKLPTIESLRAAVTQAETVAAACARGVEDADRTLTAITAEHDGASAAHAVAAKALEDAEVQFLEKDTDKNGKAVTDARHALDLAGVKCKAAATRLERAREGHAGAAAAKERADHALELAKLRCAAHPSALHEGCDEAVLGVFQVAEELFAHVQRIDATIAEVNRATRELATLGGEHLPELDGAHVLLAGLEAWAAKGLTLDDHALRSVQYATTATQAEPRPVARSAGAIVGVLLAALARPPKSGEQLKRSVEVLRRLRATRTVGQALALEEHELRSHRPALAAVSE